MPETPDPRPSEVGRVRLRYSYTLASETHEEAAELAELLGFKVPRGPSTGEPNRSTAIEYAVRETLARERRKKARKNPE